MATGIYSWSQTAASNNSADSTINWAEGQAPSSVNDSARALMAILAKWRDDLAGVTTGNAILTTGGSANAHTLTTNISIGALTNGWTVTFKSGFSNTGATTINVDSKGAKAIQGISGTALAGGELVAGSVYTVTYHQPTDSWLLHSFYHQPAEVLLTLGTVTNDNLSLVLTTYTQFRAIRVVLTGLRPATTATTVKMRASTDGGSNYLSTGEYQYTGLANDSTNAAAQDWSNTPTDAWVLTKGMGNASTDQANVEVTVYNQTSTAFYNQIMWKSVATTAAGAITSINGSGRLISAQDVDAIQFFMTSGAISAAKYAVYGLN